MRLLILKNILVAFLLLATNLSNASSITVGSNDSGNCYPFLCNDSGTSVDQSFYYQQIFNSSSFGISPITITSLGYSFASTLAGSSLVLDGIYTMTLSYSNAAVNALSTNMASNISGGTQTIFSGNLGGIDSNPSFTIPITPFIYNPTLGNLLLSINVINQANVPNGTGNGYLAADYTGDTTARTWCFGDGCNSGPGSDVGALVTTFNTTSAVPVPAAAWLFGSGLVSLIIARRKKQTL